MTSLPVRLIRVVSRVIHPCENFRSVKNVQGGLLEDAGPRTVLLSVLHILGEYARLQGLSVS